MFQYLSEWLETFPILSAFAAEFSPDCSPSCIYFVLCAQIGWDGLGQVERLAVNYRKVVFVECIRCII